jgi:predicted GIY-YIG superfamily endonuclease
VLTNLLQTGELAACDKKEFDNVALTLCATPQKRTTLNMIAFKKRAPAEMKLEWGDWFVGCPIISHSNFGVIKNSHFFTIRSLGKTICLERLDGKLVEIQEKDLTFEKFRYGWAETIRRWQGGKITEAFNIVELDKMDLRDIYTAIGRTTKWEHVGFLGDQKWVFEKAKKWLPTGAIEPRSMYEDQYLYKFMEAGSAAVTYIGRTNDPIRRAEEHLESGKKGMKLTHYYKATKSQIDNLETKEIEKALKAGAQLTNKKKVNAVIREVSKPKEFQLKLIQTRFAPRDQPERKRYRIQYKIDGEGFEERFSYGPSSGCTKKEAELLALECQKQLTNKYGL